MAVLWHLKLGVFASCAIQLKSKAKMSLSRCARALQGPDVRFPAFERARFMAASWKKISQKVRDK